MSDGGERDLRKYSRRAAIGLMGVGGGLAATETLGFTNLTADRGVNVGVVTDDNENATLRITADDDTIAGETFDDSVQIDIENNSGSELTAEDDDLVVTVDADEIVDGEELDVTSDNFDDEDTTISEESDSITLELITDTGESETASFALETQDSGGEVTVDITFDATFNGTSLTATREEIAVNDTTDPG